MAMNVGALALAPSLPLRCKNPQSSLIHPKLFPSSNKVFPQRYRARASADPSYVDYNSSKKSVFPAEACDTLGGESCGGAIFPEVKPKVEARNNTPSSEAAGVDAEYLEYDSNPKTVFPGEACDDLGGEFCEPDYQAGVFEEKNVAVN